MRGLWHRKTRFTLSLVTFFAIVIVLFIAMLMPIAGAGIVPITAINDSYIKTEVTVSGVVASINSESEHKQILTIDDDSGTISVTSDSRVFGRFYGREKIMVTGIYVGENMIYANLIYILGYRDITIAELKDFLEYYYGNSIRIKGRVDQGVLTLGETKLTIDDGTGTIDVEYDAEMADIKIGDEVVVEGHFYGDRISALNVETTEQNQNTTPNPAYSPPAVTPASTKSGKMLLSPFYIILSFISVAVVSGIVFRHRIEDWFIMRQFEK